MTTCLEKSCSFGQLYVFFVGVGQILCVLLSPLVLSFFDPGVVHTCICLDFNVKRMDTDKFASCECCC